MYASYENYNNTEKKEEKREIERQSFDIIDINSFNKAKSMYEIIIVYAWAEWCNPCKVMAPKFELLGHKFSQYIQNNQLLLLKDNIENETSIHQNQVSVIPTFFLNVKGELKEILTGVDFNKLEEFLSNYFGEKMNNTRIFQ